MPQPNVPPTSSVIAPAMSGAASISLSAAALSSLRRSPAAVAAQAGNASRAASTARLASSRPAAAASVTGSPVSGAARSNAAPPEASVHSPPISSRCCSRSTVVMLAPPSAQQRVDQVGAEPDLLVVLLAQVDVVVHVEEVLGVAVLVEPDERALDLEVHLHRLVGLVGDQRVRLARGLVDEVAGGGDPVVLQVAPLAGDRVGEHLLRVVVPVHQPGALGVEDVAPAVLRGRDPQRPRAHGVGEGDVVALVLGRRVGEVDLGTRVRLEDGGDRLEIAPELGVGHGSIVPVSGLLERDAELRAIQGLLDGARAGRGGLYVLEAPAGLGKSALAAGAVELADGLVVLRAAGRELERELGWGVARSLFEGHVEPDLLTGPAAAAGALFEDGEAETSFAILHGLYWLAVRLAEQQPLLLVVDDAHWADEPSLRFLL